MNINIKFRIFKLVYSRVPNRRGGWNKKDGEGGGKLKIEQPGWGEGNYI